MKNLTKYLHLNFILIALVLVSGCTSDDTSEEVVADENLSITSFDILSENHSFSVIRANIQPVDSLVICLFPAPVDYANLTPTITYKGTSLEYRINNAAFLPYTTSATIDFSYPNTVDFKITNSDQSEAVMYRIVVDTEQPILFNNSEILVPDSQVNTNYNGLEIDTWTNVGNYPIRLTLRTTEYVDSTSPESGTNNIFSATLTHESDLIKPNETGYVNVFSSNPSVTGTYATTAVFNLYFNENLEYIVYDDLANDYVKNIGYYQAELKLKVNLID